MNTISTRQANSVEDSPSLSLKRLSIEGDMERQFRIRGWSILGVQAGSVAISGRKINHIAPGSVVVVGPDFYRNFSVPASETFLGYAFGFQPEKMLGILTVGDRLLLERLKQEGDGLHVLLDVPEFTPELERLLTQMPEAGTIEHRCQLLQILIRVIDLLRVKLGSLPETSAEVPHRVAHVIDKLAEGQLQELSVEELARRCGCSRRHLSRIVQERFGCTVSALKGRLRLEKAAVLLQDPESKVINVAMDCGFNHLGLFSSKFKERFGDTPAQWRKKLRSRGSQSADTERITRSGRGDNKIAC